MEIKICDNTSWVTIIAVTILSLAALGMHGCHQVESTKRSAYESGLEEVQLEGSTYTRFGTPAHNKP